MTDISEPNIPPVNLARSAESLLKPKMGRPLPRRLRRVEKPEKDLTDEAAKNLLMSGRLNERDYLVLEVAWRFGVVTTDQVIRWAFYTLKNPRDARRVANRRLRFLYDEYCLDRFFRGTNEEMVYTLDVQGARLLQMAYRKDRREIRWSPRSVGEKLNFLDHYLGIANFAVNLTETVRERGGTLEWEGENTAAQTKKDGSTFEPDSIGYLTILERRLPFFLEYDLGTEEIRILGDKIRNYLALYQQNQEGWQNYFSTKKFPPILIATTTLARVEKIVVGTGQFLNAAQVNPDDFVVLLATHEALQQHGILGPAWYWAGKSQKTDLNWGKGVSLLELMGIKPGE